MYHGCRWRLCKLEESRGKLFTIVVHLPEQGVTTTVLDTDHPYTEFPYETHIARKLHACPYGHDAVRRNDPGEI